MKHMINKTETKSSQQSETGIKNASELFRLNVGRIHMAMEG